MVEKKDVKAAEAKTEVKPAVPVNEEAKAEIKSPAEKEVKAAPVKKPAAKKTPAKAAAKKEAAPKETVKKEEAPKPAAKKAPAKPAARKPAAKKAAEPKAAVHFQFDGKDIVAKDVLDQAVKAYKKAHRGAEIKSIDLYIVANEGAAYYVVNGEGGNDDKIIL